MVRWPFRCARCATSRRCSTRGRSAACPTGSSSSGSRGARDGSSEAAFEVLVRRHGPMVLRVCRNVLKDWNDAEDAFQATFLVLARRCGSIRRRDSVESWLFGVACRVAARARVEAARRRAVEQPRGRRGRCGPRHARGRTRPIDWSSARSCRRKCAGCPEKYRAAVVLCYWEGLTQEQAAAQLGCPARAPSAAGWPGLATSCGGD